MDKKRRKIPSLRFPEFKGEWEEKQFGDIYFFHPTNSLSRDKLNYSKGKVKNIHYGDIHTKFSTIFIITKEDVPFIKEDMDLNKIAPDSYCHVGDLVIADASEDYFDIGKTIELKFLSDEKLLAGLHTFLARPQKNRMAIGFAGYLMQTLTVRKQLMTIAQGIKVLSLSKSNLAKISIILPPLPEQQKIADFLTAVDDKINQLTRKKTLLEQYKKGVMQKIFLQEIRFKDDEGKEFPEWKEKRLADFLIPTLRMIDKPKNKYLAIGIRSHCKGTFQKTDSDPEKIKMDKLFIIKANDLIVNITFAWEGAIAIAKKEDDGGLVSHRFPTYMFNQSLVLREFFKYVFVQKRFRFMLEMISPGGAGRNRVMSKTDFLKLKWRFPSLPEQQKIADFLSGIDKKIEMVNSRLEKTKKWKNGLLQQMFV